MGTIHLRVIKRAKHMFGSIFIIPDLQLQGCQLEEVLVAIGQRHLTFFDGIEALKLSHII
jgi:hypothetical protein